MPNIRLKQDVPGMGSAGATRGVTKEVAVKLTEQGVAEYLDFTGQASTPPPSSEPAGKTTNAVGTRALEGDAPDETQSHSRRRRRASS